MNHQTRVYENVFEMLPNGDNPTPMVRINRLNPFTEFVLYAKLEWLNPFGSIKDRAAWALLRDLEERGELSRERGIVRAVVPNKIPLEKKILLKIAGADLDVISDELCPAPGLGEGSINLAKTHAKALAHKYFFFACRRQGSSLCGGCKISLADWPKILYFLFRQK